ncbi:hypothetical protein CALCODRAFT_535673, partial [Calocera cornea HHB12733]
MIWITQLASIVLWKRWEKNAYHIHLNKLASTISQCLSFTYEPNFSSKVREDLAGWVEQYERLYTRGRPERAELCPVTVHSLLHVVDFIEWVGPVWTTWAFPKERFCGLVQRMITARRNPYLGIDRFLLERAQWYHLTL